jgi:hypothetical protein
MEASTEAVEPRLEGTATPHAPVAARARLRPRFPTTFIDRYRFAILAFIGTRVLLILVAIVDGWIHTHSLTHELDNWDGKWYGLLSTFGYPSHPPHVYGDAAQTQLGYFPLFSIGMWAIKPLLNNSSTTAGVVLSGLGGLVATVLVQKLATGWWDEQAGRRAALLFCVFPGSVIFSMVYSEGFLIPLAAGCILALQQRRWLLAGVLAGFGTATEPDSVVLILVCAVSAGLELRRRGWGDRDARRSLLAPALSVTGIAAFAAYLWAHDGTPFATLIAQNHGWREKFDLFSVVHLATRLASEISFTHFNEPTINLNNPVGLIGEAVFITGLVLLFRRRGRVSIEAMVWTLGIAFLAMTSEYTPPNARLLITAFPAVIVFARYLEGRPFRWLCIVNALLLIELSALTFVNVTLRP